jgi:hypothetical protein
MSQLAIGDIRSFRPGPVWEARDRIELERKRIGHAMTELLAGRPHATAWSGPAALAAFSRNAEAIRVLSEIANRLGITAQVLTHLAERMQACLELVQHADRRAADGRGWVNHDGQLFLPQPPALLDPVLVAHHARQEALLREEVERDLRQAQNVARDADQEVLNRLVDAARPSSTQPPASAGHLPIPRPPQTRNGGFVDPPSAFANAAWWRSLTQAERGRAIRDYPHWVGPRDGIPAWARHRANLALLTRAEASAAGALAAARLAEARQKGYADRIAARTVTQVEERRVEALRAVREVISRRDGVQRELLAVDDFGDLVTAAVAVGAVDTAEHVATFVGGFTTTVEGTLRGLDSALVDMREEAMSITRDGADVAVVAWLGYPAPQWSEVLRVPSRSVLSGRIARDHSDELAAFLTGLDAARDSPLHSTLWAHSYGSTLAGNALLKTGAVDDVALFGSPGVPFRKLEDVGLKPGALNVLAAPDDLVVRGGPGYLGTPPLLVSGARRLATLHVKGMPNDLRSAKGHSQYRAPGTLSRRNLVAVAAGRPDLVIPASPQECRPTREIHGPNPVVTGDALARSTACSSRR